MSLRVLVVDDTVLFRHLVGEVLAEIPDVEVVGSAGGGRAALLRAESLRPDLITLDIEMPDLDGIEVLRELRRRGIQSGVVVLSALTRRGGELTMRALELGAFDFVTKPAEGAPEKNRAALRGALEPVLRAFSARREIRSILGRGAAGAPSGGAPAGGVAPRGTGKDAGTKPPVTGATGTTAGRPLVRPALAATPPAASPTLPGGVSAGPRPPALVPRDAAGPSRETVGSPPGTIPAPADGRRGLDEVARRMTRIARASRPELILIGVSTGGPAALAQMLPRLPASLDLPVLIVQHMPPLFTQSLATSLASRCALVVREAKPGEPALPGTIYIAPGGRQMKVAAGSPAPIIEINDDPPENNCRPAVDYLFRSVSHQIGGRVVAVIMTGMGSDGTLGMKLLKRQGALTIAQDEASCTVFGMPREAIRAGIVDVVLPLDEIADGILRAARGEAA